MRIPVLLSVLALSAVASAQQASFHGIGQSEPITPVSSATGVSADGTVVVGYSGRLDTASGTAVLWTIDGGMVSLGRMPDTDQSTSGLGISADGAVVVGYGYGPGLGVNEAFRWRLTDGMVGLGDFPGGGSLQSRAEGVSADGAVIVGHGELESGVRAFRWTADGGMVSLGDLPGGSAFSAAFDVSADGTVIVGESGGRPELKRSDGQPVEGCLVLAICPSGSDTAEARRCPPTVPSS